MASDAWLEQLAFDAANHNDVPDWAQDTVRKLWREYCRLEKERDEVRNKALDEAADKLMLAHRAVTTGMGHNPENYSSHYSLGAAMILALKSKEPT